MQIGVILGSTRKNRKSEWAANLIIQTIQSIYPEIKAILIDPNDFQIVHDGDKDPKYSAIVGSSNAFVIVVPEYNHGYPGRLKTLLDAEYELYKDKPVLLVGWSQGDFGGSRAVQNLLPVVRRLGLVLLSFDVHFSNYQSKFDQAGNLVDEATDERVKQGLAELVRVTQIFINSK
jgi:NAD(P)H-dependent FMN reductase